MANLPARMKERYDLVRELGRGGYGSVWLAHQSQLERPVAIKILHPHLADRPHLQRRFRREARILCRLRHPNVVQVLDFEAGADGLCLVMEYLEGATLSSRLRDEIVLPPAEVVEILAALCDGLVATHEAGLVHRDLKPGNILLARIAERTQPVLLDYGLAAPQEEDAGLSALTGAGQLIGTPAYMSPEAARGQRTGPPADLYALGIIAWEMCCGRPPFTGENVVGTLRQHELAPVPDLQRNTLIALPPGLEGLVQALLSKAPEARPDAASAADALRALSLPLPELRTLQSLQGLQSDLRTPRADALHLHATPAATTHPGGRAHLHDLPTLAAAAPSAAPPHESETTRSLQQSARVTDSRDATGALRSGHDSGALRSAPVSGPPAQDAASLERAPPINSNTSSAASLESAPQDNSDTSSGPPPSAAASSPRRERPGRRALLALAAIALAASSAWWIFHDTLRSEPPPLHATLGPADHTITGVARTTTHPAPPGPDDPQADAPHPMSGTAPDASTVTATALALQALDDPPETAFQPTPPEPTQGEPTPTEPTPGEPTQGEPTPNERGTNTPLDDAAGAASPRPSSRRAERPSGPPSPRTRAPDATRTRNATRSDTTSATLAVSVLPWGEIYVNDRHVGTSPVRALHLPPGTHELRIEHADLAHHTRITLRAGEERLIRHRFEH